MDDDKVTKEHIELAVQDLRDRKDAFLEARKESERALSDWLIAEKELEQLQEEYDRQHD